ncbi:hypothetical protein Tco_0962394, partial [Tanacetum coccineum]
ELFLGEDATRGIPNMGFNLVDVEGVWLSLGEIGSGGCETTCGDVRLSLMEGFGNALLG